MPNAPADDQLARQSAVTALTSDSELKAARTLLGLTQKQLADLCGEGITRQVVCAIEKGAAYEMASVLRAPLRERAAGSLDGDPDAAAVSALRGIRRVVT